MRLGRCRGRHRDGRSYSPAVCVQAGTALSSRVRGDIPNSVNWLRYEPSIQLLKGRVERWDYCAAAGRFVLENTNDLLLDRNS